MKNINKKNFEGIVNTLKTTGFNPERDALIKSLPKSVFVDGNRAEIDWEKLEAYYSVQPSFAVIANEVSKERMDKVLAVSKAKSLDEVKALFGGKTIAEIVNTIEPDFNGSDAEKLKMITSKAERSLFSTLASSMKEAYHVNLTKAFANEMFKTSGITAEKQDRNYENRKFLALLFGVDSEEISVSAKEMYEDCSTYATTLLRNATKNLNNKFSNIKKKDIKKMKIAFVAEKKYIDGIDTYPGTRLVPDFVIKANVNGEKKLLISEYFGCCTPDYLERQKRKINSCVNHGIPFFYASSNQKFLNIPKESDVESNSSLEEKVYSWNAANQYVEKNAADAIYDMIYDMLKYLRVEKYMLSKAELFKVNTKKK